MKTSIRNTLMVSVLASAALLVGCGGGGGGSDAPAPTNNDNTNPPVTPPPATGGGNEAPSMVLRGQVIDGYVVGATMFMDLNFNGVLDEGEPNVVTRAPTPTEPGWVMEIPDVHQDCGQYVPFVTHVPVGAVDLDDPENPITEAYNMVIPPSFVIQSDQTMKNVTPLTSIVWNSVEQELRTQSEVLTCESIIADQAKRASIMERIRMQEIRVAQRYNITVAEIYSDYVADDNSTLHGFARDLVPGLQKSYEDTLAIEAANPTAEYAYVEYYLENSDWNRHQYIRQTPGNWDSATNAMSSDLNTIGTLISQRRQRTERTGNIESQVDTNFGSSGCMVTESFTEITDNTGYGIQNIAMDVNANWDACVALDLTTANAEQALITRTYRPGTDSIAVSSQHVFSAENPNVIADAIGVTASELTAGQLTGYASHIALNFEDDADYEANRWDRWRFVDGVNGSEDGQVVYMHNSDDIYEVTTYNADGTHSKQCGTWSGGDASLTNCQ